MPPIGLDVDNSIVGSSGKAMGVKLESCASLVKRCCRATPLFAGVGVGVKAAKPAPLLALMRGADRERDGAYMHITKIDMPATLVV